MIINYLVLFVFTLIGLRLIIGGSVSILKKDRSQTALMSLTNIGIGCVLIVFLWFPEIAQYFNKLLGFGDNFNTLIFIAIIVLFMLQFKLLRKIDAKDRDISKLVREIAVSRTKRNNKPVFE